MKKYWKSTGHLNGDAAIKAQSAREFPSDQADKFQISRRNFFKVMGSSLALTGLSSCAYVRKPQQKIYPYVNRPENLIPGKPIFYATATAIGDDVNGLLVESLAGRPTKIEGNPLHALGKGATTALQQASVLNLYDPDRYSAITKDGVSATSDNFNKWVADLNLGETGGEGVGVLLDSEPSPTLYRLVQRLKNTYPKLNLYKYASVNNDNIYQGVKDISGELALPVVDYSAADLIISLDSDFLGTDTNALQNSRQFMAKRKPENGKMNRLYQLESSYTLTGGIADHRFPVKRSDTEIVLYEILRQVYQKGVIRADGFLISTLEEILVSSISSLKENPAYRNVGEMVDDLIGYVNDQSRGRAVLVAGPGQSPLVHSLVFYINHIIKAPVRYYTHPFAATGLSVINESSVASITRLARDIEAQKITTLFTLGGNPVYSAPADLNLTTLYSKINTVYLGDIPDNTAKESNWIIPRQHYLETWSDLVSVSGELSLVQPLINPMYASSKSKIDLVATLLGENRSAHELVKETHAGKNWKRSLHDGVVAGGIELRTVAIAPLNVAGFVSRNARKLKIAREGLEVTFLPDYTVFDGSFVNNSWMQEAPDPITKLTWDNAVLLSNQLAKKQGVKNYDVVQLEVDNYKVRGTVWVVPGQEASTITLKLGYGHRLTGKVGESSGFDAGRLRTTSAFNYSNGAITLTKLPETYLLASVQDHWTIEDEYFEGGESSNTQNGRPIYREATLAEYKKHPDFAKEMVEVPALKKHHDKKTSTHPMYAENMSVFNERQFVDGYQWGMTIDLSTCTGCNACMIACQSENNIPVVGKEQVLKGREMHWIRLDRYFEGTPENPRMVYQPVNCMQCEQAPCEQVCPVAATVHSDSGLNDMVYNRCIGTRYCSNNCPVKVRRFNYFDYHQRSPHAQKKVSNHIFELFKEPAETLQLQFNPDVTVRMRGVMEKCTYCVQRINSATSNARNEGREVQDGEIVTACEQVCPTGSIVFGNINDVTARVSKNKKLDRDYHLLAELNIKPRTTYLAGITNPNPKIS